MENEIALDLYSTSQTNSRTKIDYFTGEYLSRSVKCQYGAPLVAYIIDSNGYLTQGNCHHWDCPRCGVARAKTEYRRVVEGCRILSQEHSLYFITITCRGREIPLELAEEKYYAWTNRLLTNCRTLAKRKSIHFSYVQITERQKKNRAHPHSHIISTFLPPDAVRTTDAMGKSVIVSEWFTRANFTAGLGAQHKITEVRSVEGVSRYVAKYLFKDTMLDRFPPKWKRIRYSASFPKSMPLRTEFSLQLFKPDDWKALSKQTVRFVCESEDLFKLAAKHTHNVTYNHRAP